MHIVRYQFQDWEDKDRTQTTPRQQTNSHSAPVTRFKNLSDPINAFPSPEWEPNVELVERDGTERMENHSVTLERQELQPGPEGSSQSPPQVLELYTSLLWPWKLFNTSSDSSSEIPNPTLEIPSFEQSLATNSDWIHQHSSRLLWSVCGQLFPLWSFSRVCGQTWEYRLFSYQERMHSMK